METELVPPQLSEREVLEICLFCEIAKAHGSHLKIEELLSLLQGKASAQQFEEALRATPTLNAKFMLKSGLILERAEAGEVEQAEELESFERERRTRAKGSLHYARDFGRLCVCKDSRLLSVSGSVSYHSASSGDDVDFFCIVKKDAAWIFLTRVLILTRVFRMFRRDSPDFCFSCVLDEGFAEKAFTETRDALFARDALNVQVLHGSGYYRHLLGRTSWLEEYFPRLYKQRIVTKSPDSTVRDFARDSASKRALNLFLYHTAGRYIRLKSYLLNRRLAKWRMLASLFAPRMDKDHLIYESVRYSQLREKYRQLKASTGTMPI